MKETRTTLSAERQVFDVTIADHGSKLRITIRVGSDEEESEWGYQFLTLMIRHDTNLSEVLRDWKDVMDLLPQAIMEHHL